MQQKHINFINTEIHYSVYGTGNSVMLVHGFGEDSSIWNNQIDVLKTKFSVLVPDLPGSGKSGLLTKDGSGIDEYALCLKAIIDHENMDRFVIVGHSMGGYISLAFAEKYPDLLAGLALVHSGAYADNKEKIETRTKAKRFIAESGAGAFLKTSIPGLFFDEQKSKDNIENLVRLGHRFSKEALIQYYDAMINRPDRTAVLQHFNRAVLMIIGEHDKAIPFTDSLKQCYLSAVAYVHILRNSAHMGMLEEPEKTAQILADFCENAFPR